MSYFWGVLYLSPGEIQISAIEHKNEVEISKSELLSLVDGGNTEDLTDEVIYSNYAEALELYYQLMSKSPNLSIKVMAEAIDKEYTLPPALLTLILKSNPTAGKSSKLQSKLNDRMIPLSDYQRYMIDQGKNLISEKEFLEAKLSYNDLQFNSGMSQAINLILFDGSIEDKDAEIENLLTGHETIAHHYFKINRALDQGDYNLAQNILDNIPAVFDLKERQEREWSDYVITYQIIIDLGQNNASLLTQDQEDDLISIAEKHSNSVSGLANQTLEQFTDFYVLEGLSKPGNHNKAMVRNGKEEVINPYDNLQYIHVFPNPADDIAIVEFVGYDSTLILKLFDSKGKVVMNKTIEGKKMQETLLLDSFSSGAYTLIIDDGSEIIYSEKIIIKR